MTVQNLPEGIAIPGDSLLNVSEMRVAVASADPTVTLLEI